MSNPVIVAYLQELNFFWDEVEEELKDRRIDKIYLDAFYGKEKYQTYVEKKSRSRNFDYILKLEEKGAELMITEDIGLVKAALYVRLHEPDHIDLVDFEREQFIAQTVDETLLEKETGVLFLGVKHKRIIDLFEALYSEIKLESREEPEKLDTLGRIVSLKYHYGI